MRVCAPALLAFFLVALGPGAGRALDVWVADRALMIHVSQAEAAAAYRNPIAANAMGMDAARRVLYACGLPQSITGKAAGLGILAALYAKYAWDIGGRIQQTRGQQRITLQYPANVRRMCEGLHSAAVESGDELIPGNALSNELTGFVNDLANIQAR